MFNKDRRTNPYKAPQPKAIKPLARGQSTLGSFFGNRSASSTTLDLKLNRSKSAFSPPPLSGVPSALKRSSSLMLKKTHSNLDGFAKSDDDDDDLIEIKAPINNFKNSLLPSPIISRNSSFSQPSTLRANILNNIITKNQEDTKKRSNPWTSNPVNVKNPRLRDNSSKDFKIDTSNADVVLSEEQRKVIHIAIQAKRNIFYTGSAGTGKSVLLRELVHQLKQKHGAYAVAVTASTGLAAVNIGGMTINRFSGCGLAKQSQEILANMVSKKQEARERWRHTKVLIIDEVSMLDGDFLDKLEYVAREVTRSGKPFGGIQVILTGDFFQLPPVPENGKSIKFCFEAKCWNSLIQEKILLKKVFRQRDTSFVDLLNSIRTGLIDNNIEQEFKSLSRPIQYSDGIQPTELYPTRNEVEIANKSRLAGLAGDIMNFIAEDTGAAPDPKIFENAMAVKELKLKVDAQVMMLKNIDETLVNGSVGKIIAFIDQASYMEYKQHINMDHLNYSAVVEDLNNILKCTKAGEIPKEVKEYADKSFISSNKFLAICKIATLAKVSHCYPLVRFSVANGDSRVVHVEAEEFPIRVNTSRGDIEVVRKQLPLLLSWALSIHKSQGQTLDRVKVDLRKIFEAGQVYVALSRAVSKERLQVLNFEKKKIFINNKVAMFYQDMERTKQFS